ncbi:MFS transporter [Paenibacillus sp. 32O-W]|uniref:MFS transporter n=1 Tax=Paenibacillus sp. 32O-W TaxID=1695218 RepID=UPI0007206B36|nr:MFS transporter [Paenibacillus sp. 32O-W]ALS28308.1 MFS transporter [Paenibacillus sp. 32O-W]
MPVNLYYFLFFYVVFYMGNAVYGTFLPVYFVEVGYTEAQIGTLLSLGPLVAIIAQPVWGTLGDRAATKNQILKVLIAGSGISMLLYPLSDHFYYLMVMICVFTFFQTSAFAISDAITLETIDRLKTGNFGLIRMGGTIGYAIMSVVFGMIAVNHIGSMFVVYAIVMAASFLLLTRFPAVAGHQSKGRKMRIWVLFRNRKLVLYLGISFVIHVTLGYYYSFFPVYFKEIGGNNALLGWSMLISSLSEIPFLLFASRIMVRIPIPFILMGAAGITAIRWYVTSLIHEPLWILPVQMLHGLVFIVLSVTMATFINREVPDELKASGQTLNGLLSLGIARIIGSFAGGMASESFGMRSVFFYNSIITVACIVVFAILFWVYREPRSRQIKMSG